MGFGKGPTPPPIALPPAAAHPPTLGSAFSAIATQASNNAAKAAEGMGFDNTIKTSPQGDTSKPNTAPATLLGQTKTA